MRHIAIIGSGPAGYYTAEGCQKAFGDDVRIDIIDRLPVPFGLIRSGVAPDHQSIKHVARRYEAVALTDNVRFLGNVTVGQDVQINELLALYDAHRPDAAMALLHRALEIDPLSEEFNRELMLRWLEAGEPHRAAQHLKLVARRFRELLDAEPSADLAGLVAGA